MLQQIDGLSVCPGHPGDHFVEMGRQKKSIKDGRTSVKVNEFGDVSLNGQVYLYATLHISSCEMLSMTQLCWAPSVLMELRWMMICTRIFPRLWKTTYKLFLNNFQKGRLDSCFGSNKERLYDGPPAKYIQASDYDQMALKYQASFIHCL